MQLCFYLKDIDNSTRVWSRSNLAPDAMYELQARTQGRGRGEGGAASWQITNYFKIVQFFITVYTPNVGLSLTRVFARRLKGS